MDVVVIKRDNINYKYLLHDLFYKIKENRKLDIIAHTLFYTSYLNLSNRQLISKFFLRYSATLK